MATFLVINLPFIAWGPAAWFSGVLAPLSQHALPYGQGLVGLSVYLRVGGGAIDAYSYAAALLYLALLAWFIMDFGRLARCCFVLPSVALFVSGRSLSVYWTAWPRASVRTSRSRRPARGPDGAGGSSRAGSSCRRCSPPSWPVLVWPWALRPR
jgi:uncharacterized membrane protein